MTFTTLYEIVKHSVEKFSAQIAYTMLGAEDVTYEEVADASDTCSSCSSRPA